MGRPVAPRAVIPITKAPACFDSATDYAAWVAAARKARTENPAGSICDDCTGAYAARMRALGRCDHPFKTPGG